MARPVIGVNCSVDVDGSGRAIAAPYFFVFTDYADAVRQAGGMPLVLPFLEHAEDVEEVLDRVDGLLLTGGDDIDPALYAQDCHAATRIAAGGRAKLDLLLAQTAVARGVPVLGVCMGMQLLNVMAGGDLVQHLPDSNPALAVHRQPDRSREEVHVVLVEPDSRLARLVGTTPLPVNSTHHQAVGVVAPGLRVSAKSQDGIVEAVERAGDSFVLGVQWHPERLFARRERHGRLFRGLVDAAEEASQEAGQSYA